MKGIDTLEQLADVKAVVVEDSAAQWFCRAERRRQAGAADAQTGARRKYRLVLLQPADSPERRFIDQRLARGSRAVVPEDRSR